MGHFTLIPIEIFQFNFCQSLYNVSFNVKQFMDATILGKMVNCIVVTLTQTQDVKAGYSVLLTHMDVHVSQDSQEQIAIQVR